MQEAADKVAKDFATKKDLKNKKIVVIGFRGLFNSNSEVFSQIIESELTTSFINAIPQKIVARIYMDEILEELQFSNTDIFNEENRKQIGLLSSADIIVSGTYRFEKNNLSLTVQAIDLETGIALASTKVEIKKSGVPINPDIIEIPDNNNYSAPAPKRSSKNSTRLPVIDIEADIAYYGQPKVSYNLSTNFYFSKYMGVGIGGVVFDMELSYAYYDESEEYRSPLYTKNSIDQTFYMPYLSLVLRWRKSLTFTYSHALGEYVGTWRMNLKYDMRNVIFGIGLTQGNIPPTTVYVDSIDRHVPVEEEFYSLWEVIIGYRLPIISRYWE
jgi:TolB-like protein